MSAVGNTSTSKTTIESPIDSIESTIVSIKSSIESSCISTTVSIPTDPSSDTTSDTTSDSSIITSTLCTIDGRCRTGLVTPSLTLPSKPCTPLLVLTRRSMLSVTPLGSSIVSRLTVPLNSIVLVSEGQVRTLAATVNSVRCCLSISCLCCASVSYE